MAQEKITRRQKNISRLLQEKKANLKNRLSAGRKKKKSAKRA